LAVTLFLKDPRRNELRFDFEARVDRSRLAWNSTFAG